MALLSPPRHRHGRTSIMNTLIILLTLALAASFSPLSIPLKRSRRLVTPLFSTNDEAENHAVEALQSLVDFHEGTWQGKARSFAVTADVAAGIVHRKTSPAYRSTVKLGLDLENRGYKLTETLQWGESSVTIRKLSLGSSNADVDSVDASYSLDATLPDWPSALSGTDKLPQFMIEHCIVAGENHRVRALTFYGVDQSLIRIVLAEETRVAEPPLEESSSGTGLTAADLIEMRSDVDRLVEKLTSGMRNKTSGGTTGEERIGQLQQAVAAPNAEAARALSLHTASLLELSSGVWLGDSVIRDVSASSSVSSAKGFGEAKKTGKSKPFAKWAVGVQKTAWRWMWNFGEEIRQINDVGKSLGSAMDGALSQNLGGSVCVNEGLSRRTPKEERMVYIDWDGDNVGFLSDAVYIQSANNEESSNDEASLPDIVCSNLSRVYSFDGDLKQGCSSFYTFKRFGTDIE